MTRPDLMASVGALSGQERAERDAIRAAVEHAPASGPVAPDLVGLWTLAGWYVCAPCAGRIMARGCGYVLAGAAQVWREEEGKPEEPRGVCCTCRAAAPCNEVGRSKRGVLVCTAPSGTEHAHVWHTGASNIRRATTAEATQARALWAKDPDSAAVLFVAGSGEVDAMARLPR